MLRDLNTNEMQNVSGGDGDEIIVTGTIQSNDSGISWHDDPFGFGSMSGSDFLSSIGMELGDGGGGGSLLTGADAQQFLTNLGQAEANGDVSTTTTTTIDYEITVVDTGGNAATLYLDTPFGRIKIKKFD